MLWGPGPPPRKSTPTAAGSAFGAPQGPNFEDLLQHTARIHPPTALAPFYFQTPSLVRGWSVGWRDNFLSFLAPAVFPSFFFLLPPLSKPVSFFLETSGLSNADPIARDNGFYLLGTGIFS